MLSQVPSFLESGVDIYLKLSWLLPLAVMSADNVKAFFNRKLMFFYIFLSVFFIYCFALENLTGITYVGIDLYNMAIALLVCVVSFAYWDKHGSPRNLAILSIVLLVSGLYLAVVVYTETLSAADLSELQYAFEAKNSMGQILLNAFVVVMICAMPKNKFLRAGLFALIAGVVIVIFMLKSRATIASLAFIVGYLVFMSDNKKIKYISAGGLLLATLYILLNQHAYEVVVEQILFGNRNAADLNNLTSGRVDLFMEQVKKIPEGFWFGTGNDYMDCFPLMMLVQYGFFGAMIVLVFLIKVAKLINFQFKPRKGLSMACFLLFWAAMVNSLFEAQPPFGPGVKCFMVWATFGMALSKYSVKVPKLSKFHIHTMIDRPMQAMVR